VGRWATRAKIPLGVYCQMGMLAMVFTGAVRSGIELRKIAAEPTESAAVAGEDASATVDQAAENTPSNQPAAPHESHLTPVEEASREPVGVLGWSLLLFCVLAVHLLTMAIGLAAGRALGISYPQQIAVAFSGSQKTLLIGLDIAVEYIGQFGGLALIPMVTYHVTQLLVDTLIADRFKAAGEVTLEDAVAEEL
jgi:hypothetical protein